MSRVHVHIPDNLADRVAENATGFIGTWGFVFLQIGIIAAWIAGNTAGYWPHPDGWPFIALNLLLSAEAALATGIILISQNRQAQRDRAVAQRDDEEIGMLLDLQQQQMVLHQDQAALLKALHDHLLADGGHTDASGR